MWEKRNLFVSVVRKKIFFLSPTFSIEFTLDRASACWNTQRWSTKPKWYISQQAGIASVLSIYLPCASYRIFPPSPTVNAWPFQLRAHIWGYLSMRYLLYPNRTTMFTFSIKQKYPLRANPINLLSSMPTFILPMLFFISRPKNTPITFIPESGFTNFKIWKNWEEKCSKPKKRCVWGRVGGEAMDFLQFKIMSTLIWTVRKQNKCICGLNRTKAIPG